MRCARLHLALAAALLVCAPTALGQAPERPPNPCLDPVERAGLRCPDLEMSKPFGLTLDPFVWPGHVVLRAGNSINSVGRGPAELFGVRDTATTMRARQRIHRTDGGRIGIDTGARLIFKRIPGQGHYWKFLHAAKFELFRRRANGTRGRRARRGPKVSYCLRDLKRTRPALARSPRRYRYPACDRSSRTPRVTLGTSVGWSDIYPPAYHEQWIDVTGLRGCFDFVHTADPRDGIYESDETNNSATVTVRLPFRPGPQRCPGPRSPIPRSGADTPVGY